MDCFFGMTRPTEIKAFKQLIIKYLLSQKIPKNFLDTGIAAL